ncbi:pentatricopeptide repeat-containing protein At4g20770-like [Wolffia australiana]
MASRPTSLLHLAQIPRLRTNPSPSTHLLNAQLSQRCHAGDLLSARHLLRQSPHRNATSYAILIRALLRASLPRPALQLFPRMLRDHLLPSPFTLGALLSACDDATAELGKSSHGVALKLGLASHAYAGNAIASLYSSLGHPSMAAQAFDEITLPDVVSFTVLLSALAHDNLPLDALRQLTNMAREGLTPDAVALSVALVTCSGAPQTAPFGLLLHAVSLKLGLSSDLRVANSLMDMYVKSRCMAHAERVLTSLPAPNVVSLNVILGGLLREGEVSKAELLFAAMAGERNVATWNTLIGGLARLGREGEAVGAFRAMQGPGGVRGDRATLAVALAACAATGRVRLCEEVHARAVRGGLREDVFVAGALVDCYCKCGAPEKAVIVFQRAEERDGVCWTAIISGLVLVRRCGEAAAVLRRMRREGVAASDGALAAVIAGCARAAALALGRQLHALAEKEGLDVGSSLVGMYAKTGEVEAARAAFEAVREKSTVAYNEMIVGYARNGEGAAALGLFEGMVRAGARPDAATFTAVLAGLSHGGMADEAVGLLGCMARVHGVEPAADHVACVVDALGRAGRLAEMEALAEAAAGGDWVVWEAAYAAVGRWDGAQAVREEMGRARTRKEVACSWTLDGGR